MKWIIKKIGITNVKTITLRVLYLCRVENKGGRYIIVAIMIERLELIHLGAYKPKENLIVLICNKEHIEIWQNYVDII